MPLNYNIFYIYILGGSNNEMVKKILGNGVLIANMFLSFYLGAWKLCLLPIIQCANAYGNQSLTAGLIIVTILKMFLSELVTCFFALIGCIARSIIINWK